MKGVDAFARVHRELFVHGTSFKNIGRELLVARNTVRKVLLSDEAACNYEREVLPPLRLGRFQVALDCLLAANVAFPSRTQLTLIRICKTLRSAGLEGGYREIRPAEA